MYNAYLPKIIFVWRKGNGTIRSYEATLGKGNYKISDAMFDKIDVF